MKKLHLTLLLTLIAFLANSSSSSGIATYKKLCELNRYWRLQTDINPLKLFVPIHQLTDEKAMIRFHLQNVESTLRQRDVSYLGKAQQVKRLESLDHLHAYWQKGVFPSNTRLTYRNPVFIDAKNNYCAVGYLIKASGHDDLSRRISLRFNEAYLDQMKLEELNEWVKSSGFTLEELAWIQPGYEGTSVAEMFSIGKGTNGTVYTLEGFSSVLLDDILLVGGSFTMVNDSIPVANVGLYNYSNNSWTNLGKGFNNTVRKLLMNVQDIYAGGSFTMSGNDSMSGIAKWDKDKWIPLGRINGTVYDIEVTSGNQTLYIAGDFTFVYQGKTYSNLAVWTGNGWKPVFDTINGIVYTLTADKMYLNKPDLFLGGDFTKIGDSVFNHVASFDGTKLQKMGDGIPLSVTSMCVLKGNAYACGEIMNATDTFGFAKFTNGHWLNLFKPKIAKKVGDRGFSNVKSFTNVNTFQNINVVVLCGEFDLYDDLGNKGNNVVVYNNCVFCHPFTVLSKFDSIVHVSSEISIGITIGGSYKKILQKDSTNNLTEKNYNTLAYTELSMIAYGVNEINVNPVSFAPNPLEDISYIQLNKPIKTARIYDVMGRQIITPELKESPIQIHKSWFSQSGIYFITITTSDDKIYTKKFLVQ